MARPPGLLRRRRPGVPPPPRRRFPCIGGSFPPVPTETLTIHDANSSLIEKSERRNRDDSHNSQWEKVEIVVITVAMASALDKFRDVALAANEFGPGSMKKLLRGDCRQEPVAPEGDLPRNHHSQTPEMACSHQPRRSLCSTSHYPLTRSPTSPFFSSILVQDATRNNSCGDDEQKWRRGLSPRLSL